MSNRKEQLEAVRLELETVNGELAWWKGEKVRLEQKLERLLAQGRHVSEGYWKFQKSKVKGSTYFSLQRSEAMSRPMSWNVLHFNEKGVSGAQAAAGALDGISMEDGSISIFTEVL